MRGFVCELCRHHTPLRRDQFAERVELRRLDGKERVCAVTQRYICRSCLFERIRWLAGEKLDLKQGALDV